MYKIYNNVYYTQKVQFELFGIVYTDIFIRNNENYFGNNNS